MVWYTHEIETEKERREREVFQRVQADRYSYDSEDSVTLAVGGGGMNVRAYIHVYVRPGTLLR